MLQDIPSTYNVIVPLYLLMQYGIPSVYWQGYGEPRYLILAAARVILLVKLFCPSPQKHHLLIASKIDCADSFDFHIFETYDAAVIKRIYISQKKILL